MSSTTNNAEQRLKAMRPAGLRRSQPTCGVIIPLRHLSLRHSSLHLSHAQHNGDMEVLGCLLEIAVGQICIFCMFIDFTFGT